PLSDAPPPAAAEYDAGRAGEGVRRHRRSRSHGSRQTREAGPSRLADGPPSWREQLSPRELGGGLRRDLVASSPDRPEAAGLLHHVAGADQRSLLRRPKTGAAAGDQSHR